MTAFVRTQRTNSVHALTVHSLFKNETSALRTKKNNESNRRSSQREFTSKCDQTARNNEIKPHTHTHKNAIWTISVTREGKTAALIGFTCFTLWMEMFWRKRLNAIPSTWSSLGKIENLSWIQEPLEFLHQFSSLVASRFRIEEDDDWPTAGHRDRLDDERPQAAVARVTFFLRLVRFLNASDSLAAARRPPIFLATRRLAQAGFEILTGRQFHDPRWWHDHRLIGCSLTCLKKERKKSFQLMSKNKRLQSIDWRRA